MIKKISMLLLILTMIITLSACKDNNTAAAGVNQKSKIKVVVSFNAMREFTEAVGKDKVYIETMIPDGTEPHDFEPKAKDLRSLSDSKIFVYNGFGMETWIDKTLKAVDNKNLIVVDASSGYTPIKDTDSELVKNDNQEDPHLWLSLKGAESEAANIKNALIKADPADKDYFEKNYSDFKAQLDELLNEYDKKFQSCSNKEFITGHAAFAYFAQDFGLKQNSVEDVFADGEPSAKKLKELTDYCKQKKFKSIFVEEMVSPKVSETLAKEVGAKAVTIHTIESKEKNKDYVQCMKENLEEICDSMK
ncbi:MAG: zinc ABC transporter substrate-binding protein [Bacillota bacterium]|nr:zinc ABC transporter substrate-binding protein [Bacillota bacterium]